ncbi:hypothetical protein [Glutamicibacter uratoxydans]|uniref:hypothetical protein n=1 Tax=Glutamicibacter uratoxydans TaxID=43667 RepID=UPI003D6EF061
MDLSGLIDYFGLNGSRRSKTESVTGRRRRWQQLTLCLILAVTVFFLFRWLLEDATGFTVYVPYLAATSTLLTSQLILRNSQLEAEVERQNGTGE